MYKVIRRYPPTQVIAKGKILLFKRNQSKIYGNIASEMFNNNRVIVAVA